MSRIRADNITNRMANGAPTAPNGLVVSGVTTVTTLDLNGDLDVDGHLNADNVSIAGVATATTVSATTVSATTGTFGDFVDVGSNIKIGNAGVITATSFSGSGANLTGIDATSIKHTNGDVRAQATASGVNITGNLGLGNTTTAGRNAGVSTATGAIIYNTSDSKLQVYNGTEWDSAGGGGASKVYSKTVFAYQNVINSNISIASPYNTGVIYTDPNVTVDIESGKQVDVDANCILVIADI